MGEFKVRDENGRIILVHIEYGERRPGGSPGLKRYVTEHGIVLETVPGEPGKFKTYDGEFIFTLVPS